MKTDVELCLRLAQINDKSESAFSFFNQELRDKMGGNQNLLGPMLAAADFDVEKMPEDFLNILEEAEEMAGVTQAEIDQIKAIASGEGDQ